jgi:hypothetical protein
MLRLRITVCLAIGIVLLTAILATAQSTAPVPFGNWAPKANNEHLSVTRTWCKFDGNDGKTSILIEGECSWDNPTTVGAILTIMNVHFYQTAPVRFSIVWVNPKTIKVNGEAFNKQN